MQTEAGILERNNGVSVVKGDVPFILGLNMMKDWKAKIDIGEEKVEVNMMEIEKKLLVIKRKVCI